MKEKILFLFIVTTVLIMVSVLSVSSQTPDIETMSNEQLMLLLQAIKEKLGSDEMNESRTAPDPDSTSVFETTPETTPAASRWQIYKNKKLILERIPDDRFIQNSDDSPEPTKRPKKDDSHGFVWDDDVEACPPGLFWDCTPERCICISPNG